MRIYKAYTYDKDCGKLLSWHSSKAEAERAVRDARRDRREHAEATGDPSDAEAQGPEGVVVFDIAPTRAAVLAFLNAYFTSDNG